VYWDSTAGGLYVWNGASWEIAGQRDELLQVIAATKSVTAVDVFVYDTSKDSDGGAWRKRTQGTSWYNETLDTATRGSRKEFPAVAVIVAEADTVTIYDGDDPSLPMWMVFNAEANNYIYQTDITSVQLLNGQMGVGQGTSAGLSWTDFVADRNICSLSHSSANYKIVTPISTRNGGTRILTTDVLIVSGAVNDVAMTVLPDAPIDPATGLPVPTIAVATDGGVSVIKDDGTVVDITWTNTGMCGFIAFNGINQIVVSHDGTATRNRHVHVFDIPNVDLAEGNGYIQGSAVLYLNSTDNATDLKLLSDHGKGLDGGTHGGINGLALFDTKKVAYITSTYNTGWMNGDIKGAFLSDTDDTDLVETEFVPDPSFDDPLVWVTSGAVTVTGGQAVFNSAANNSYVYDFMTIPANTVCKIEVVVSSHSEGDIKVRMPGSNDSELNLSGPGTYSTVLTGTVLNERIWLIAVGTTTATIDSISVKLADEDRSVNANGLTINGTITRDPVATGADLVAYSGFSASNYLEQPYNSDLDFGTGDFCVMWWCYGDTNGTGTPVSCTDSPNTNGFRVDSSGAFLRVLNGGLQANFNSAISYTSGVLRHMAWVISENGTLGNLYQNGVMVHSGTQTARSIDANTDRLLTVGTRRSGSAAYFNGSIALLRISATAPTAEQIAKIYNDEKFLFQENAQATLYGTSDAVTALAHDSDTNLLHVGTSAGRSVFQGLRRVSNTTTAVGTAISASNGLVVEE